MINYIYIFFFNVILLSPTWNQKEGRKMEPWQYKKAGLMLASKLGMTPKDLNKDTVIPKEIFLATFNEIANELGVSTLAEWPFGTVTYPEFEGILRFAGLHADGWRW
jgi:hypothetical protein